MKRFASRVREHARDARAFARTHPKRMRALATTLIVLAAVTAFLGPFAFADADARQLSAWADGAEDVDRALVEIRSIVDDRGGTVAALATSSYLMDGGDAPPDVLVVFGVERPYTRGEVDRVLDFVASGGTLLLANDVSGANALTREFGIVFADRTVLDFQRNYLEDPRLAVTDVTLDDRAFRVVMNMPGYMTIRDDAPRDVEVLAWSTGESNVRLVRGDDGTDITLDTATAQSFPLAARTTHGDGHVIVFADTGAFMNKMLLTPGFENRDLVRALTTLALGEEGRHVLVDESRHAPPATASAGNAGLRLLVVATSTPLWNVALGLALLAAVVAAVLLKKDTEDWSVHAFDVGHARPSPESLAPTPSRLQDLAQRAVSENFNIPVQHLQSASFEELVNLTGDRELVAVATGKERGHASPRLYEKLIRGAPIATVNTEE